MLSQTKEFPTKLTWEKINQNDYSKFGVQQTEDRKLVSAWNVATKKAQVALYQANENVDYMEMLEAFHEVKESSEYNTVSMFNVAIKSFGVEQIGEKQVFYSVVKSIALQKVFVFELHFKHNGKNMVYFVRFENEPATMHWNDIKKLDVISDVVDIVNALWIK